MKIEFVKDFVWIAEAVSLNAASVADYRDKIACYRILSPPKNRKKTHRKVGATN